MIKHLTLTLLFALSLTTLAIGQIRTPAPSPGATVMQTVGLTEVEINYSRPGVKDRTIFAADGLVPFGEIWRTGANAATKITFSTDVEVAGAKLEKGSYAILTKPGASEWEVHFFTYNKGNWTSYLEEKAVAIVKAKPSKTADMTESFTIGIGHIEMDAAHLTFTWANTKVAVPMKFEVEKSVMADIDRVMAGPSGNDFYQAATFLHTSGKDLDQALTYIQKATNVEKPKFWQVRREALILADLGKKKDAIAAAKKSIALAKEAKNDDYVAMNEKSIKEWSK